MESSLDQLSEKECLALLSACSVGRVAMCSDLYPVIVPVNYRFVPDGDSFALVIRTRPDNTIDRAHWVAFEIDGVDDVHRQGWSVLVRGIVRHLDTVIDTRAGDVDPDPWVADRDSWLLVRPVSVSGRRLVAPAVEWRFAARAYL